MNIIFCRSFRFFYDYFWQVIWSAPRALPYASGWSFELPWNPPLRRIQVCNKPQDAGHNLGLGGVREAYTINIFMSRIPKSLIFQLKCWHFAFAELKIINFQTKILTFWFHVVLNRWFVIATVHIFNSCHQYLLFSIGNVNVLMSLTPKSMIF